MRGGGSSSFGFVLDHQQKRFETESTGHVARDLPILKGAHGDAEALCCVVLRKSPAFSPRLELLCEIFALHFVYYATSAMIGQELTRVLEA